MKKMVVLTAIITAAMLSTAAAQPGLFGKGCCAGDGPNMGKWLGKHQGMRGQDDRMGGGRLLAFKEKLGLTESQVTQIKKRTVELSLERVDLKAKLEKAQIELRGIRLDESASERQVFEAIDNVAAARAALGKMKYRHRKELHAILTSEQQEKFKSLGEERRFERREFRGSGGDGVIEKEVIIEKDDDDDI